MAKEIKTILISLNLLSVNMFLARCENTLLKI